MVGKLLISFFLRNSKLFRFPKVPMENYESFNFYVTTEEVMKVHRYVKSFYAVHSYQFPRNRPVLLVPYHFKEKNKTFLPGDLDGWRQRTRIQRPEDSCNHVRKQNSILHRAYVYSPLCAVHKIT